MVMTGDLGKLYVGYQLAATLRGWTITRQQLALGDPTVSLVGVVEKCNVFWSTQRPLILGVWTGSSWWIWTKIKCDDEITERATVYLELDGGPIAKLDF